MRKPANFLIAVILLAVISVFLSACQVQTPTVPDKSTASKTLTIATSFYPMYIAAVNVAKDVPGVKVVNITQPTTGCLHDYQLKPDDLKTLSEAQIFIVNGAGMEAFMDKVVSQLPDLKIVDASKGIPLIKGDGEEGDNPHVWVSISNAIQQVKNIGLQLAALDPEHAAQYNANTTAYVDQLDALRVTMHQNLDGAKKRDIITFHEAFPYFAREFNLNIVDVIEREPGSEPSAAELADTIETIKESNIKALFAEPQYPAKAAETIARETGAKVYTLDPAVTGSMEPDAYLKTMEANMKTLEEALN
ncbi:MAG: High-affinity zinc uptake system binding-protein ZnuA precursor [Pelotomaculum sp. PtaB.Bin013]|uniref:Zinc ABC transporter substrate-binding protein n=1 Tax=Pelotomaculum isophthalicicum JI TaxID=947010 RepID=A0A9X4H354_9FIRM|nr:metal ABC transporter substrate-binding protein [Pelotomaculum isophthalicicum]MDF9408866.1 zinc ABC transporter substrate-binding protein [Pelotomaculum isophthalicicum JI]OPX82913.1 MAG: High-affinity zinc uptake system binding-protein ZnuA precursor [Pelotomaculum sp. PtaB.Bin013]